MSDAILIVVIGPDNSYLVVSSKLTQYQFEQPDACSVMRPLARGAQVGAILPHL